MKTNKVLNKNTLSKTPSCFQNSFHKQIHTQPNYFTCWFGFTLCHANRSSVTRANVGRLEMNRRSESKITNCQEHAARFHIRTRANRGTIARIEMDGLCALGVDTPTISRACIQCLTVVINISSGSTASLAIIYIIIKCSGAHGALAICYAGFRALFREHRLHMHTPSECARLHTCK